MAQPGQSVNAGDVLLSIETEKTTYEVEAESDGIVQQIAKPGDDVEFAGVLGYLLSPGEHPVG